MRAGLAGPTPRCSLPSWQECPKPNQREQPTRPNVAEQRRPTGQISTRRPMAHPVRPLVLCNANIMPRPWRGQSLGAKFSTFMDVDALEGPWRCVVAASGAEAPLLAAHQTTRSGARRSPASTATMSRPATPNRLGQPRPTSSDRFRRLLGAPRRHGGSSSAKKSTVCSQIGRSVALHRRPTECGFVERLSRRFRAAPRQACPRPVLRSRSACPAVAGRARFARSPR
jgi:hypothetical protein